MLETSGDVVCSWAAGVLLVQTPGMFFTPEKAAYIRERVARELQRRPAVKVLVDLRPAVFLLTAPALARVTAEALANPVEAPVGFLVEPPNFKAMHVHCEAVSATGRTRRAFTSLERAVEWVRVELPALRPTRLFVPQSQSQSH